jgi:CRP/FNR family transcriptional regulator
MSSVRLCRFQRRRFTEMLAEFPHLQRRLLEVAGNEIIAAQDQMLLLGRKTARERLASFLAMLARRRIHPHGKSNSLDLAMGRGDIADYLGLTTETVSRTFTQLKKAGIIALPAPGQVDIVKRQALDALCETA